MTRTALLILTILLQDALINSTLDIAIHHKPRLFVDKSDYLLEVNRLINLVLGRTEVAKEEISSILATDLNGDLLKTSIDKECDETLDYFQSILGQI